MSMRKTSKILLALTLSALFCTAVSAQQKTDSIAPEAATARATAKLVTAKNYMVAAANPLAAKAGYDMLAKGGNAIDAMVAVQTVLGLVEPQSSGLGGGAFLVYFDAGKQKLSTYDGRETAPMAATPQLFQDANGKPLKFYDAVVGGRSVGTPGTPRLLYDTHAKKGKLPWAEVLAPAIKLATEGFKVSNRLHMLIEKDQERLSRFKATADYFLPNGTPLQVGATLKNPAYAHVLTRLAAEGPSAFYRGEIASDIVKTVQTAAGNPGVLALEDLQGYTIKQRPAVCTAYRAYEICGMGPPSSGALTVGQILGQLEPYDLAALGPQNPESWRLIGDASRLAFADRGRYMADSDFVPMPTKGLVNKDYLQQRAKLLTGPKALDSAQVTAGTPPWDHASLQADDESIELPSTSHFSIVDTQGNAVSMTTTIENGFGSRLMTNGFLLNNELTDFSFRTHKNGVPIANRVEPSKRPRSSMAPTIVLQNGKPVIVVGSPGGSRIIGYVAQSLIAMIDWQMDVQAAINMPHAVNRFGTYDLEKGTDAEKLQAPLEAMGFKVNLRDLNSGLHGIVIGNDGLQGGADPRREGVVVGN
ncbi:gamma-glutamyltransferase [Polycladidibacter stylochi]|uniref:gamma-glutamyltransferase n=1 Tax=Polycladidibacter stylochi TaxID=1807766 RepID=UPI000B2D09D3|nr:gamma-glutamyltransferase [Pseudovibrio stylochi]